MCGSILGAAGIESLRTGNSSPLIGAGIGEVANGYFDSRFRLLGKLDELAPIPASIHNGAKGFSGFAIGEGVDAHQEKIKNGK